YKIQTFPALTHSHSPPIVGRAYQIHYPAHLHAKNNDGVIPTGPQEQVMDVGTGSPIIYPILGDRIYGWSFLGTDIDATVLNHARSLVKKNSGLSKNIVFQLQENRQQIFEDVLRKDDYYHLVVCNQPFYN